MTLSSIPLNERPSLVRSACTVLGVDGFIIPRGDEYLGEYVAPCAERLAWLTGFTGSAGLAAILPDRGAVFSDGRYTVQMEEQVPHALWERRHSALEPLAGWLTENARGLKIGYDPRLVSQSMLASWQVPGVELVALAHNPIDKAWTDRPAAPASRIIPQPLEFSGESSVDKRRRLGQALSVAGHDAAVIADCTSLAWLLNIRGHDVPLTPVAHGYVILHADGTAEWFVSSDRFSEGVTEVCGPGVTACPPADLVKRLEALKGRTVRVDPVTTAVWFDTTLADAGATVVDGVDPCTLPKAIKNAAEQEGARQAHTHDGVAMARFLHSLTVSGIGQHETDLVTRLDDLRARSEDYQEQSFDAISAVGPNGAFPHYRAQVGHDRVLEAGNVYLIDSGGQYPFGTTDITRTLWVGNQEPPANVREAFTRVLKGNIALSRIRFPPGTTGHRLDVLARAALWQVGMDYDHGTGHGIGSYLSVHEGPQNISPAPRPVALEAGMIVSNEPGYYEPGQYGIRIENLMLVRPSSFVGPKGAFLEFEILSFTPIDRRLIDVALLNDAELNWLNAYHAEVEKRVMPYVEPEVSVWLTSVCKPLVRQD
ncbi:aminopeptidase P family protein [Gluconobacter kanchanaburiensis]|uniref:Xaa-Pro aminopeptidase n=1 Tax=Gluconobacter kanchanaburiensis NBRC 103587 TaxID=1307948 RepID=A0A511BC69_9PROT|nr:aminopeptidase P family protein [Gluconobacter kanchanaburiensis]MBF0861323.1 aminopeptidase P family protein [Gluconobacter kanchanaburiensis]GBR71093.1 Xaa-Pro aminopeptidase [Gluconobacter kanchanaburiensis NBRC 103587]GEK97213.1 Xaa-Pro aminopeptidase [Gluconobacter kanchanaburiensis NBRC 103587]